MDWESLVRRLLLFTHRELRHRVWRGLRGGPPPDGIEAEDFVQNAIFKTINGTRAFDPQRSTLFQHLASVIASDMHHLALSYSNRNSARLEEMQEDEAISPEYNHSEFERCESLGLLLKVLGNGDQRTEKVLRAIVQYNETCPRYIAEVTGFNVEVVYSVKKKLRRRLQPLQKIFGIQEMVHCTIEQIQLELELLHRTEIVAKAKRRGHLNGL